METRTRHKPDPILPKYGSSFHHVEDIEAIREKYESLGIDILEDRDELTWRVSFPDGWTQDSDGGYWINVYDKSGKERFIYFCKMCFWDYDMFVRFRD